MVMLLLLLGGIGSAAQPLPVAVQERTAAFFKLLIAGEEERAYVQLLAGGPLEDSVQQAQIWRQVQQLHERYGLPLGYEVVQSVPCGEHLLRLLCLGLYEQRVLWWELLFYRSPRRGWIVVELSMEERTRECR